MQRILLVEDDPKTAAFIKPGLREEGFSVQHIDNGQSGLELCSEAEFDALIVDIMLPKLDGLRMVEQLRAVGVTKPVLFFKCL